MGMCKSCGIVFNDNDIVNGYCEDCKPEFFTEEYKQKNVAEKTIEKKEKSDLTSKQVNLILISCASILLLVIGIFIYNKMTKPSDSLLKNMVMDFKIPYVKESEISIVNSYDKYGKTVYVIDVKSMICEMPIVKSGSTWKALEINCK